MEIQYSTIYTKCQDLSAYEGSRLKDSQGESLYEIVAITEQDSDLVEVLCEQAEGIIAKHIAYAISGYEYDEGVFKFTEKPNYGYKGSSQKDLLGSFVAYVMLMWLTGKADDRANVWKSIFDTSIDELKKGFRRNRPSINDDSSVRPSHDPEPTYGKTNVSLSWLIENQNDKLLSGATSLTLSASHDKELGSLCVSHHEGGLLRLTDFGGVEMGFTYDPSALKGRLTTSALETGLRIKFKHPKYENEIELSVVSPLAISVNYNQQ